MSVSRTGTPGASDYRLAIPVSRGRLAGLTLGAVLFVLAGTWMLNRAATDADTSAAVGVVGIIGIAFFGFAAVFALRRMFQRPPAVTVDATGIHDHAAAIPAGTIPWSNVAAAHATSFGLQSVLAVAVHDPQQVVASTSGLRRRLLATNAGMMGTPVNIPGVLLPVRMSWLASEINGHLAAQEHAQLGGINGGDA